MHPVFELADARVLLTPQLTQHLQHRIDRVAHEHFESHKLIEERLEDPVEEFFRSLESAVVREVQSPQDTFHDVWKCLVDSCQTSQVQSPLTEIPWVVGAGASTGQGICPPATQNSALSAVLP